MDPSLGSARDIMFSFTSSMALKAVVQLGVLDILHRAGPGASLTAREIASELPSQNPNIHFLSRILRFLGSREFLRLSSCNINIIADSSGHGKLEAEQRSAEYRYGLTDVAKWFVRENPRSLAPFLIFDLDEPFLRPFHRFAQCVLEGGTDPFTLCHGKDQWSFMSENAALREEFDLGLSAATKGSMEQVLGFYNGFKDIHTLVDVGGATGQALSLIISAYPHIRAINFDLPHVIEGVPKLPGIQYVGGNMFESVPSGDAFHFKSVLHDWDDEACVKVLENCYKIMPPEGRVIITDVVVDESNLHDPRQQRNLAHDMVMLAHRGMGKERTELEWRNLLFLAGFPRAQVYEGRAHMNVIEAFKW